MFGSEGWEVDHLAVLFGEVLSRPSWKTVQVPGWLRTLSRGVLPLTRLQSHELGIPCYGFVQPLSLNREHSQVCLCLLRTSQWGLNFNMCFGEDI